MDERALQFRVGWMVLAALISAAILVAIFGNLPTLGYGGNTIYAQFSEAPDAASGTPVRKNGILIGRVTGIQFVKDDTAVRLTLSIYPDRTIYHDEVCRIVNSLLGVGGDTVVEFVRAPKAASATRPSPTAKPSRASSPPTPAARSPTWNRTLGDTMSRVQNASDALGRTFTRIDKLLSVNENRITTVIAEADDTFKILKKTLDHTDDIIGSEETREQFKKAITQLPDVLTKVSYTAQQLGDAMGTVRENLANLKGLTEPLGRRGTMLVERMTEGTDKLKQLMDEMLQFSHTLNGPDSSIGQLVNNPELAQHVCRAVKNVDELTRQLKPILDDARVFSDKIARHPEVLGVRGAVQRSPGIK